MAWYGLLILATTFMSNLNQSLFCKCIGICAMYSPNQCEELLCRLPGFLGIQWPSLPTSPLFTLLHTLFVSPLLCHRLFFLHILSYPLSLAGLTFAVWRKEMKEDTPAWWPASLNHKWQENHSSFCSFLYCSQCHQRPVERWWERRPVGAWSEPKRGSAKG